MLKNDLIVARTEHGICFVYNQMTKETLLINKNENETIRSTFLNTVNNSIFIVSVKSKSFVSIMKCRAISVSNLLNGNTKGTRLFKRFTL